MTNTQNTLTAGTTITYIQKATFADGPRAVTVTATVTAVANNAGMLRVTRNDNCAAQFGRMGWVSENDPTIAVVA